MAEGAFLSSLVDRLSTTALSGITSLWGVKEQVDSLIHELQAVECFLKDADLREIRRQATSNNNWFWLHSLRDAAYDAEDLIESVELHEGRYHTLNPLLQPLNSYRFAKQINEIKSRFQSIIDGWAKNASMLRELRDMSSSSSSVTSAADSLWRRSSCHLGDDVVVGREEEAGMIIDLCCLFTRTHTKGFKRVRIHGLLCELARSEARESRFFYCENGDAVSRAEGKYYRRLALHTKLIAFHELSNSEKLRSLLIFPGVIESCVITVGHQALRPFSRAFCHAFFLFPLWGFQHNILEQLTSMQYIRVLELEGHERLACDLKNVQSNLNHLRYMSLRNTNLGEFPFPESNFPLLQTLDIRGTFIRKLPGILESLDTLRHIYLNWRVSLDIRRLTNLQTLHGVIILPNSQAERNLMALTNLRKLRFRTWRGVEYRPESPNGFDIDRYNAQSSMGNENHALAESLRQLGNLHSIFIMMPFASFQPITSDIVQAVTSHEQLHKLKLQGRVHRNLLLEDPHFSCIKSITLSGSWIVLSPMESLGSLTTLYELKLKDDALRCSEVSCLQNSFPELRYLKISGLKKLRVFHVGNGSFPNLTRFSIHNCTEFLSTVEVMEHATRLQVLKIKEMPSVLPDVTDFCHSRNINLIS
uniref:Uncharacterized protein n=1 Tax=Oryza rufipogon TaxID=4529 RepID=A0A0E0P0A6_ORYRU